MQCVHICPLRRWQINRARTPFQHDLITLLIRAGKGEVGLSSGPETIASEPWFVRRFFHAKWRSSSSARRRVPRKCLTPPTLFEMGISRQGSIASPPRRSLTFVITMETLDFRKQYDPITDSNCTTTEILVNGRRSSYG